MKAGLTAIAIVAFASTGAIAAPHPSKDVQKAVAAALADPARADQAQDDDRRKAAAVIAFAGVGPGDTVVDFLPGSGYWTRIFTGVVGPKGHVDAVWPAAAAKGAEKNIPLLTAKNMANVSLTLLTDSGFRTAKPADVVWTVQNYHDLNNSPAGEARVDAFNADVFRALKPGGTYIVIDHADSAGSGLKGTSTTHRIDPAAVKAEVTRAGFTFVGESDVLKNAADDHSLPVFDPAIRGHTDQFVYKFRKPR